MRSAGAFPVSPLSLSLGYMAEEDAPAGVAEADGLNPSSICRISASAWAANMSHTTSCTAAAEGLAVGALLEGRRKLEADIGEKRLGREIEK